MIIYLPGDSVSPDTETALIWGADLSTELVIFPALQGTEPAPGNTGQTPSVLQVTGRMQLPCESTLKRE